MTTELVTVPGTWSRPPDWWSAGSPWWGYMNEHGFAPALPAPFEWEATLGSSWFFWRRWGWGDSAVQAWRYAGKALEYYLDALPPEHRVVVAHSHGGQVALFCAAEGVQIDRLVTVSTPYRHDMQDVIAEARPNIRRWVHVSDRDGDKVAFWGRFGDGQLGGGYKLEQADINYRLSAVGHSGLLSTPALFPQWAQFGLTDFLHDSDQPEAA